MGNRLAILLALAAAPAAAWEYTPGQPCLLEHAEGDVEVALTYDPTAPLYSISVTRAEPFAQAPVFAMEFLGAASLIISTNQHSLSADGRTVTVTDRGFGNVLNGLQYNQTARALLGDQVVSVSLNGAAEPTAAFRECKPQAGV